MSFQILTKDITTGDNTPVLDNIQTELVMNKSKQWTITSLHYAYLPMFIIYLKFHEIPIMRLGEVAFTTRIYANQTVNHAICHVGRRKLSIICPVLSSCQQYSKKTVQHVLIVNCYFGIFNSVSFCFILSLS